jgi:hypothetical protein
LPLQATITAPAAAAEAQQQQPVSRGYTIRWQVIQFLSGENHKEYESSHRLEASKGMRLAKAATIHHVLDAQLLDTQTYHLRVSMLLSASHCFGLAALPLKSTLLLATAAAAACEQTYHAGI